MQIERIKAVAETGAHDTAMDALISVSDSPQPIVHLEMLIEATIPLSATLTRVAAERLKAEVSGGTVSWRALAQKVNEVGERLKDELDGSMLIVVDQRRSHLLAPDYDPMPSGVAPLFPSSIFEVGEAGKCLALHRPTASAFHSIRALEVSVMALAKFLAIPDPIKGAERNWGKVLEKIKSAMDMRYQAKDRMPGMVGAYVESVYATLDAVKGPWRNATMHVDRIYQLDEAEHILGCVRMVFGTLARVCDEDGAAVAG